MNQIELIKTLKDITANAAEESFTFASKIFTPELYGGKVEFIILFILGIGIISWYFAKKFINITKPQ